MVKQNRHSSGIGGSLILIIFIVLTLTVFSVLTLVSARNELGTVNRTAKVTSDYYAAEKAAAEKCAQLQQTLEGVTDPQQIISLAVQCGAQQELSSDPNVTAFSFSVEIDDRRSLKTVIQSANGKLKISAQSIVSTGGEIIIDDGIGIWDGSSPLA